MAYIISMGNIKIYLWIIAVIVLAVSCGSGPKTDTPQVSDNIDVGQTAQTEQTEQKEKIEEPASVNYSDEYYVSTKEDVQHFIEGLNRVISSKNYNAWKNALSPEYFAEISSPGNLQEMSEQPAMKRQKIVLKSAEDYFLHVVVPSRANSKVDDIEFISMDRVKAFTINTNRAGEEQRLRLYDLEKIGDKWIIIN